MENKKYYYNKKIDICIYIENKNSNKLCDYISVFSQLGIFQFGFCVYECVIIELSVYICFTFTSTYLFFWTPFQTF